MTCPTHALCPECYAGCVDVGMAKPEPVMVVQPIRTQCCQCGVSLDRAMYLIAFRGPRVYAFFDREYPHMDRDGWETYAAGLNRNQVVHTDHPHVGQEMQPS